MLTKTYPRYFEVDDLYVILKQEGDEIAGYTAGGRPYPPRKAIVEGHEITEEEYINQSRIKP